jgi:type III secretion protein V
VGILQHNMTAGEALKRYGLLTIGDGLVTQIPALVTSTAAGLLVTRVASEDPDSGLGTELGAQLFGTSRALSAASAFVLLLALIPGLPSLPFAALALILFFLARNRRSTELRTARESASDATPKAPAKAASKGFPFVPVVVPWEVAVGSGFSVLLNKEDDDAGPSLRSQIMQLRNVLFSELGLPLPTPRLRVEPELPALCAIISIREVPIDVVPKLEDGASEEQIEAHSKLLVARTHKVLQRHGFELLGIGETQLLLDALEQVNGALVRQVVPKPLTLGLLSEVLRRLLEERVSIRDLRTILENLAPIAVTEKDPLQLAEAARGFLRRAITFRLTGGARELPVYIVDPSLEDTVRSAITRTPQGAFLTLPPSAARDVQKAVAATLQSAPTARGQAVVVLCSPDVRRFFRKLLETELPDVYFTSFAELEPELRLIPRARIMHQ